MTSGLSSLKVQHAERNSSNRSIFRRLSREVCREILDIPENNNVIFAYENKVSKKILIGGATYQLSDPNVTDPGLNFDHEFFNHITFMFVKMDFQMQGIGRMLITESLDAITRHDHVRPIRVESAERAIGFFEKNGL